MPSLANYMIATSMKDYIIDNKNRLEKKYIVPLSFGQTLLIILIISTIVGYGTRIKYNGLYGALAASFQISWYGMGWGKTPWYVAVLSALLAGILGALFGNYVTNTKFRHNSLPMISMYEVYTLAYNTIKYECQRMLCRRPKSFHQD